MKESNSAVELTVPIAMKYTVTPSYTFDQIGYTYIPTIATVINYSVANDIKVFYQTTLEIGTYMVFYTMQLGMPLAITEKISQRKL